MCFEQNKLRMINGNQNHWPIEVWIQNHTQNQSGKWWMENENTGWSNFCGNSSRQFKMRLSSVCGLHVPVCTPYNVWACSDETTDGHLRDLLPDLDQGISPLWFWVWFWIQQHVVSTIHDYHDCDKIISMMCRLLDNCVIIECDLRASQTFFPCYGGHFLRPYQQPPPPLEHDQKLCQGWRNRNEMDPRVPS